MIDFVITWVDGNDPKWRKKFESYSEEYEGDKRTVRYRDWDLLQYWFRGVAQYAPWVNCIFFVTEGHIPNWLNTKCPKLKIVKHSDFIPKEYLPLFNSRAIEVNLHRIHGLSEHFVYFNDDFFLINTIKPSFFFNKGLPCDIAVLNALDGGGVSDAIMESLIILNRHFNKRTVICDNVLKWFNYRYGSFMLRTLFLLPWPNFTGFYDSHLPTPFLKSTFIEVWQNENDILCKTSKSNKRTYGTVNPYIFRYWQLLTGKFYPQNPCRKALYIQLSNENLEYIISVITQQKKAIVVLNDSSDINDFDLYKHELIKAFDEILPTKSCYEI